METVAAVKYGGRKKGTPNRLTKEVRTLLKNLLFSELSKVESHFEKLDPKDRVELLIKLMPFICPKVKSENYNLNEPLDFDF